MILITGSGQTTPGHLVIIDIKECHIRSLHSPRPLKSLPVRQKTGDVFHHPDIPILDMEELVREAMASRTPGDTRGHQPPAMRPAEIRMAWDYDTKLKSKTR